MNNFAAAPGTTHTLVATNAVAVIVDPNNDATNTNSKLQNESSSSTNLSRWVVVGLVLFAAAVIAVVFVVTFRGSNESTSHNQLINNFPTPSPTISECPMKRIRITEICDVPDLDDDIFGTDTTMDIKILVNDEQYWPSNPSLDCDPTFGSYSGSCVIPDTSLIAQCYALKNPIAIPLNKNEEPTLLKITIYDEDIFTDDFIDILVPSSDWYFPSQCNPQELELHSDGSHSAYIKLVVDSGPFDVCGLPVEEIAPGLEAVSNEIGKMRNVLDQYVTLSEGDGVRHHRQLFLPALFAGARVLVTGVTSFGKLFARGAKAQGPLSTLADFTTIGSALLANFGKQEDQSQAIIASNEAFFEKVFERFDEIDQQLEGITSQLQGGFEQIELVIQEGFAKQEMDDLIGGQLAVLNDDYRAYIDKSHTDSTREVYKEIFRGSCQRTNSPFTIFKVLYSHGCKDCQLLDGQSQQYILDTFTELAKANFDDITERVIWFRKSFGTVMVAALTEALYLHSVCLYQPDTVCQKDDPVWSSRLEQMGEALEEIASSLTDSEAQLQ